jgi:hypothetical protein
MGDGGNIAPDSGGAFDFGLRVDECHDDCRVCREGRYIPLRTPSGPDPAIGCQGPAGLVGQGTARRLRVSFEAASDLESVSRHHIRRDRHLSSHRPHQDRFTGQQLRSIIVIIKGYRGHP